MRFYVYELRDENDMVFYVGKGSGQRINTHEQKARHGEVCHRAHKIREIWARGGKVGKVIVWRTDCEREALTEEIRLISLYGREVLTNKTDGGDGTSNLALEAREKIAASRRGVIASEETRRRQREAKLGTKRTEETRAKISRSQSGVKKPWASLPKSEEYKRAMSIACQGKRASAETCSRISAAKMGHTVSAETRAKISASKQGTPAWNKGIPRSEEMKRRISNTKRKKPQ